MIHYDVQLFGGTVLHQGKIAEMATGEGKTLVATCPVFLNALTGNGVHVVTVNDYLAKRDSEWMGPLYMFHGLSVDCIDKHRPNSEERRKAYQADITFGTNNEFGFDYLRDNMAMQPEDLVQRKHNFAIVDEVDSVLIDDARTPLIISGPVPKGDVQMFEEYQPLVEKIVAEQRKLATSLLAEAKQKIAKGNEEGNKELTNEGFLALFRSYKALPKNTPLVKFLSEDGIKSGMLNTEEYYMENNNRRMPEAIEPLYFVIDEKLHGADLTDKGVEWLSKQVNDKELFVIPDITSELSALDIFENEDERLAKKDALMQDYALKSERVHTLQQLLKAYSLYNRDDEYVVINNEVKIVDEQTGRIMEGRRWSDGLHQAVEAKEHVKVEAATQTYATITLQNYFRMYHKLSGMTGTASTEAGEFWDIYKLDVVEIPTNKPVIRKDMDDRVYKTNREKYKAGIDELELELYRNPDHMPHLEGHGNALSGSEGDVLSLIDVEVARGEVEILQGVSFACRPGRIVLVAGRMGAGKSSALSVLSGVTKPDNGKATLGQHRVRVGDVGFVMQRAEDQLFCPTVFEDVSFGPKNAGLSDEEVEQRAAHALEQVRLHKSLWRRPVEALSGGEERLVAIAGMLAIDSDVALFDEPTAGLDGWGRKRIREIVCELRDKGCAVVISSHDVDEWLPFADDVVLLRQGTVSFADTRDDSIASAGPWVQAGLVAPAWIRAAAAAEVGDSGMRAALSADDVGERQEEGPLWGRPSYTRSRTGHLLSLTALVVLSVTLFFVAPNLRFVAAAVLCVVYALFNHLRKRDFLQVLKVAAIPLAFAFAGNALVVDGSGDMVLVGPVGISLAGLGRAIVASSRIYLLCLLAFAFSRTTTATDLAHMIVAPCRLFAWAGLNVERVEMVVSLTLRTIPVTIEQMIRVTQAQLIRGAALNHGPIKERISAWSSVLLPVIVSTVRHSEELTLALAERGYTDEEKPHGNT